MELNLNYVHTERIGYGRLGTFLAAELEAMGVTVYDDLPSPVVQRPKVETDGLRSGRSNVAAWVSAPAHARGWWKGQTPVMFTMYEAMELPASFTENLHEFDTLIVPSKQNQDLFGQFHPNVRMLPLGVDPSAWRYTPRQKSRDFNFLIGGSGPRKGVDLAIRAFLELYGDDRKLGDGPIPRLILKSPRGLNPNGSDKCITQEAADHPRVQVIGGYLSGEDEVALYESAHCYLQPSRGEGFGLQPLQAIAQGLPTILTAAHGHDTFSQLGYGLLSTPVKSDGFLFGESGDWWEPSYTELKHFMRWVYDYYDHSLKFAERSAAIVARELTWRRCAERFVDIIGPGRLGSYTGPDEWYTPKLKLYEVVTTSDRLVDVAGTKRFYKRGQVYWEPADVKRILFTAGFLDGACLKQVDTGLHPDQLGDAANYSAAQSYCPTCEQRLGTHPSKSDDLFAEANGMAL